MKWPYKPSLFHQIILMNAPVKVCKNCGNHFVDKYCSHCGQKAFEGSDRRITTLFGEMFHFVTHFEGTFWTSPKTMLLIPGQMSLDYCNGIRKKYFKPVSMFLFIVVLYLVFPGFSGLNVSLNEYRQSFLASRLITSQIESIGINPRAEPWTRVPPQRGGELTGRD